ncbi:MAG: lysophospholipid acyltransferase family protein [Chloroflexota bacterium]
MKPFQVLFFVLIVRPIIMIVLGLNTHNRDKLPLQGPAIIAANHNSHLDTVTLMSLWPLAKLSRVRPIAAADYFLKTKFMAWFSLNVINIIPLDRHRTDKDKDPLADLSAALQRNEIIILFPEGSRGEPEQMSRFKTGISRLVERHPEVPIIPIFMYGLGKALPRGDFLLVPFFCDVSVGEPIYWQNSVEDTMNVYQNSMQSLAEMCEVPEWE